MHLPPLRVLQTTHSTPLTATPLATHTQIYAATTEDNGYVWLKLNCSIIVQRLPVTKGKAMCDLTADWTAQLTYCS